MDIDQRASDLANHLLDVETKSQTRKNKRSPSDIDKFIKSTQWLSKRILSDYAASKKAQTRFILVIPQKMEGEESSGGKEGSQEA